METAAETATRRASSGPRSLALKSRVTNGKKIFFINGDGRSVWTRRWRDISENHCIDLSGSDRISEAQLSLVRRAAALTVELESMEARLSEGDLAVDLDLYNRLSGNLRRFLEVIGVERKPRLIGDSLDEIVDRVEARRAAAE